MILLLLVAALTTGCGASIPNLQGWVKQTFYEPCGPAFSIEEIKWSPDSSQLAYIVNSQDGSLSLYVVDVPDGLTTLFAELPLESRSLVWSPDKTRFLALSGPRDTPRLVMIGENGQPTVYLTDPDELIISSDDYSWSPDGLLIALAGASQNSSVRALYILDLTTGHQIQLTPGPADSLPAWSPDGQHIAFVAFDLFVVDSYEGTLVRLTTGLNVVSRPVWSPDGTQIAFVSHDKVANGLMLNVISRSGTDLTTLGTTLFSDQFLWQPGGNRILYMLEGALASVGTDGQRDIILRQIIHSPHWRPHLSPDGSWIAEVRYVAPANAAELVIESLDGSEMLQLTRNPANQLCLKWP